ncbi:MAG: hypothetical protein V4736_02575 [Bdellovibrionota bacterium]
MKKLIWVLAILVAASNAFAVSSQSDTVCNNSSGELQLFPRKEGAVLLEKDAPRTIISQKVDESSLVRDERTAKWQVLVSFKNELTGEVKSEILSCIAYMNSN